MSEIKVRLVENDSELEQARDLRVKVFVVEQNVPLEEEFDGLDDGALHAVAVMGGRVIGTGRLLENGHGEMKIGRMAVEEGLRRKGAGGLILRFLEEQARQRGAKEVMLHAQTYVKSFYKKHGYIEEGKPFIEANIEHIMMKKRL